MHNNATRIGATPAGLKAPLCFAQYHSEINTVLYNNFIIHFCVKKIHHAARTTVTFKQSGRPDTGRPEKICAQARHERQRRFSVKAR